MEGTDKQEQVDGSEENTQASEEQSVTITLSAETLRKLRALRAGMVRRSPLNKHVLDMIDLVEKVEPEEAAKLRRDYEEVVHIIEPEKEVALIIDAAYSGMREADAMKSRIDEMGRLPGDGIGGGSIYGLSLLGALFASAAAPTEGSEKDTEDEPGKVLDFQRRPKAEKDPAALI